MFQSLTSFVRLSSAQNKPLVDLRASLQRPEMPAVTLYEMLPLLDSSDMGPDDWRRIASFIETLYPDYDG